MRVKEVKKKGAKECNALDHCRKSALSRVLRMVIDLELLAFDCGQSICVSGSALRVWHPQQCNLDLVRSRMGDSQVGE